MGVRVAYGQKEGINEAIETGVIPKDSIIITKEELDPELLFYDSEENLRTIAKKTRFETLTEAKQWVKTYDCAGSLFTIHNGADWTLYIVADDGTLSPFTGEGTDIEDIKRIDGGTAEG